MELRLTATNYESIKARADEMEIPLKWALGQRRQYLEDLIRQHETDIVQAVSELAGTGELEHCLIMDRIDRADKGIRKARFDLSRLKPNAGKGKGVDDTEIERAKGYPIEALLPNQVRRGMTLCPFHEDHYPSMSIKNNRAHCFACNKTWDSIELLCGLQGYGFIEAVRYLNQ